MKEKNIIVRILHLSIDESMGGTGRNYIWGTKEHIYLCLYSPDVRKFSCIIWWLYWFHCIVQSYVLYEQVKQKAYGAKSNNHVVTTKSLRVCTVSSGQKSVRACIQQLDMKEQYKNWKENEKTIESLSAGIWLQPHSSKARNHSSNPLGQVKD